MYDQLESIENLANNFHNMSPDICFTKEKITNFYFPTKFKINFKGCHVAICKNGGFMAICKKQKYLDTQRYTKINNNVIVMSQNAKKYFLIPISWNYNARWVVSFDFTENENLYGICNDGTIYKFDTLSCEAKEQPTHELFKQGQIYKAKFIENGFIALTCFSKV